VTVIHGAVSYTRGALLADSTTATGGGFITTPAAYSAAVADKTAMDNWEYRDAGEVPTFTLEELFEIAGVDGRANVRADLVKFDCEGGEIDALRHMSRETAARIGDIVGEYHIDGGYTAFEAIARGCFPSHRFEGRQREIDDRRPIGWFRAYAPEGFWGEGR
jgi:FkbM family methyltransferase